MDFISNKHENDINDSKKQAIDTELLTNEGEKNQDFVPEIQENINLEFEIDNNDYNFYSDINTIEEDYPSFEEPDFLALLNM